MFTVIPNGTYATVKHDGNRIFDVVFSFACTEDQKSEQVRQLFDMVIAANASEIAADAIQSQPHKSFVKRIIRAMAHAD